MSRKLSLGKGRKGLITNEKLKKRAVGLAFVLMLITMLFAITAGKYSIPVVDVFKGILAKLGIGSFTEDNSLVIVWEVRLPRLILSALGGMALAMAGACFQGVFKNPLVEPYILGVSSGAAFGAALSIVFLSGIMPNSVLAFVFAVLAMLLSYTIATNRWQTPLVNLILSGIVISSIFTALLNLLKTVAPDSKLREITFWLMGGYYTATWQDVVFMLPSVIISLAILWSLGWKLNVLTMGEQEAQTMGISVDRLKLVTLGISTFITAAIVSHVGIISWIGLMIPHGTRMIIGSDHRYLIPFSAFAGGIFMIICDTIARTIIMGEIPISIITSIIGAPYLIYLLRTNRQVYFE